MVSDHEWWEYYTPNETYQDEERTRPFVEVDRSVEDYLLEQDPSKQRSVTHADVIRIMRELGHELSYEKRMAILQRLRTMANYSLALSTCGVEHGVGMDEIRPFVEVHDWPVIMPPGDLDEERNLEWCRRLVDELIENGWRPSE